MLATLEDDIFKRIKQYYNGFQFAINSEVALLNPWSILSFSLVRKMDF
ncbi:MAG: hypothetical protein IJU76_01730 [Desulfovibrionaceae bacterium]|nr:hypothetical protein [Desulfovibrionaceae bacterium]